MHSLIYRVIHIMWREQSANVVEFFSRTYIFLNVKNPNLVPQG